VPPRGTRDILPAEARLRRHIVGTAEAVFTSYGYGQITTPTFEETGLFVRGVGESTDIVRKEMYTFADFSGDSLTLRPEGTAPVARAFIDHGMHTTPLPAKLWYCMPMFRYERPQAGRYREHWQLGAEAIGSNDPMLDVETIALLADLYARLGVPGVTLRLGSMGDAESRAAYRDLLVAHVETRAGDLDEEGRIRLQLNPLRLFDSKDAKSKAVMEGAPLLIDHLSEAALAHHRAVCEGLDALGIAYVEDGTLVRGFDYYTKTVFEFTCDRLGAQSGIGGGGRYDGLVEGLGGPSTPGIGFGTGIERIVLALEEVTTDAETPLLDTYLAVTEPGLRPRLLPLAAQLRARGLAVDSDMRGDRKLKAMMKHANSLRSRTVVIIGPREIETGVVAVRDMTSGEQIEVALDGLADALLGGRS
jgi:histidyl-tRNA synthetase